MQKGRDREAEHFLAQMVGSEAAGTEIKAIRDAIAEESGNLLDPAFRKPLVVAILIALFSQFTGINTIIYYGSLVFLEHVPHQTATTALWANVVIGAINFIATILGMSLIDRAGRKPLLMSAFAGMALSLMAVSAAIHFQASAIVVLIFVLTYVACFAVGVGTGTWVMMSEICPYSNTRAGNVSRNYFPLVRNVGGNVNFSVVGQRSYSARHIPLVCGSFDRCVPFRMASGAGDQRPHPGRN